MYFFKKTGQMSPGSDHALSSHASTSILAATHHGWMKAGHGWDEVQRGRRQERRRGGSSYTPPLAGVCVAPRTLCVLMGRPINFCEYLVSFRSFD